MVPSATFETRDGRYVIIGGNGDSIYSRLMAAVGRADMGASNERFKNNTERCKHDTEIYEVWSDLPLGVHMQIVQTGCDSAH